jgi:hypothetical protein
MQKQPKFTLFDKLVGHRDATIQPPTSQQDESSSSGDGILNKETKKEIANSLPTRVVSINVHEANTFIQHLLQDDKGLDGFPLNLIFY